VHAAADAASPAPAPVAVEPHVESPTPAPALSGRDLLANALLAARQDARADRELSRFESAPRRRFVGAQTREARFALYVDQWREKIERTGNHNYPADARGRVYGSLRLTVAIRADGSIESLEFDRRSGRPQLDQAAERIVRLAAPFAAFPPDLRRDTDVLVITRTWYFEPGDTLRGE
jgi:protein TonB